MSLQSIPPYQKAAFVSLMIEIVNADGVVHVNEFIAINKICSDAMIDSNTFAMGKDFDLRLSLATLKEAGHEVKCDVGNYLIDIAAADGTIQAQERAVLHMIFHELGILDDYKQSPDFNPETNR